MWSKTTAFRTGLALFLLSASICDAFILNTNNNKATAISPLQMISFGGIGGGSKNEVLPRDVKDAVSRCRQATQEALQKRTSRMDIEFPVGTKFGVEKGIKKQKGAPTIDDLERSNRELARLFVEMFQPLGADNISVVFRDEGLSDSATQQWKGDVNGSARIFAMNRSGKKVKKKSTKNRGFAAKLAAEIDDDGVGGQTSGPFKLPPNTEVALFVAPGPKELVTIAKICSEVGMGTLVVLLNARLAKIDNFGSDEAAKLFTEEFEPVFCLTAASQDVAPDCLLFRSYPGDWVMARKPKVGQPKPVLTQATKPTLEECATTYASIDPSELDSAVENALENVAGWFR